MEKRAKALFNARGTRLATFSFAGSGDEILKPSECIDYIRPSSDPIGFAAANPF